MNVWPRHLVSCIYAFKQSLAHLSVAPESQIFGLSLSPIILIVKAEVKLLSQITSAFSDLCSKFVVPEEALAIPHKQLVLILLWQVKQPWSIVHQLRDEVLGLCGTL